MALNFDRDRAQLEIDRKAERSRVVADYANFEREVMAYIGGNQIADTYSAIWDGESYPGGLGLVEEWEPDYWTMRQRSAEFFTKNKYAFGLIERMVTNFINTGVKLDPSPDATLLGMGERDLDEWTDEVEPRFDAWARVPTACDYYTSKTFYELQEEAFRDGLIEGDVLVVLRFIRGTNIPAVQLYPGRLVVDPAETLRAGHTVDHGVEYNAAHREVAYWVAQEDGTPRRLPKYGSRSGMQIAWLYSPLPKRQGESRAQPLLVRVFQDLNDINKYRDAALRQAAIMSMYVAWVERNSDKPASLPISSGATMKKDISAPPEAADKPARKFAIGRQLPGAVVESLEEGESIKTRDGSGVDINFGEFETAVIRTFAWSHGIPPEILELSFSSNYSASQAATSEFLIAIQKFWARFGSQFCDPIYQSWLVRETDNQVISAPGLIEAFGGPQQYAIQHGWTSAEWYGTVKPSLDVVKQSRGSELMVQGKFSTRTKEARRLTGLSFKHIIRTRRRELEQELQLAELENQISDAQAGTAQNNGGASDAAS